MKALFTSWQSLLRIAGTTALIAVLIALVPRDRVIAAFANTDASLVCIGMLFSLAARFAAAERTWAISRVVNLPLSRAQTLESLFIANFWSLVLPSLSAGTITTVYRYRRYGCALVDSIGVLGASRILELLVFSTVAAAAYFARAGFGSHAGAALVLSPMVVAAVAALLAAGLFVVHRIARRRVAEQTTVAGSGQLRRKLSEPISRLMSAFARMTGRAYAASTSMALIQCILEAASLAALAASLHQPIDLMAALWVNGVAYLAMLLPISIAGLGAREVALVTTAAPLGIAAHDALAISLLMFVAILLNGAVGGLLQLNSRRYPTVPQES